MTTLADWGTAPDWAQWFAIDEKGFGSWYEKKPVATESESGGYWALSDGGGMWENHYLLTGADWHELIEQRPAVQP